MMEVHSDMSRPPMIDTYAEFETHVLDDGYRFFVEPLPGRSQYEQGCPENFVSGVLDPDEERLSGFR
jgi:hypothetical protein